MSTTVKSGSPSLATAPRILVTGNDLLAGALAGALERYGFATMRIASSKSEIDRGLEWSPDLVLFDDGSFDEANGSASVQRLRRRGFQICVIEASNNPARRSAWLHAGASELVDRNEPFDQLLLTITRLLQVCPAPRPERRSPASLASMQAGLIHDSQLERFASLTDASSSSWLSFWRVTAPRRSRRRLTCRSPLFVHRSSRFSRSLESTPSWPRSHSRDVPDGR